MGPCDNNLNPGYRLPETETPDNSNIDPGSGLKGSVDQSNCPPKAPRAQARTRKNRELDHLGPVLAPGQERIKKKVKHFEWQTVHKIDFSEVVDLTDREVRILEDDALGFKIRQFGNA